MRIHLSSAGARSITAAAVLLVVSGSGYAVGVARATTEVKACKTAQGVLVVPKPSGACPQGSSKTTLGKQGPRGPRGTTGAMGATGATGPAGAPGPAATAIDYSTNAVASETRPTLTVLEQLDGFAVSVACWRTVAGRVNSEIFVVPTFLDDPSIGIGSAQREGPSVGTYLAYQNDSVLTASQPLLSVHSDTDGEGEYGIVGPMIARINKSGGGGTTASIDVRMAAVGGNPGSCSFYGVVTQATR